MRNTDTMRRAVGDRIPITPPEAFQGLTNEEYELLWPSESNTRNHELFFGSTDQPKKYAHF